MHRQTFEKIDQGHHRVILTPYLEFRRTLALIGLLVSEKKMFENLDVQLPARVPSCKLTFGSGELMIEW